MGRPTIVVLNVFLAAILCAALALAQQPATSYRFDFGGRAKSGFSNAEPKTVYSAVYLNDRGFGFEPGYAATHVPAGEAIHCTMAASPASSRSFSQWRCPKAITK
jgi:hypothetical protein